MRPVFIPEPRSLAAAVMLAALAMSLYAEEPVEAPGGRTNAAPERRAAKGAGAVYVPLESWVYAALDRLAALGLIRSQISGLRPWTRVECHRQTLEAKRALASGSDIAGPTYRRACEIVFALLREFGGNEGKEKGIVLESLYTRNGFIAGPPLTDSFHFGQTWINNLGRPFGRGWNSYEGFTARAQSGRFFANVQGEYQHAPGAEAYSQAVREAISQLDGTPIRPAIPVPTTNRLRILDTYAGVRVRDLQISAGKQSLWWGPTYDAPLSFSNNAEPTNNLKVSLVDPIRLPGVLRYFGDIRGEFVIGKLGGQSYTWRPWFNAQKLSFKLTKNLEMGFTRWSIFWGVGHPITARSFIRNFTSTASPLINGVGADDPGDRKGGFDFRYRLPGLRDWVTIYTDSYCDDDPSPLAAPRRAAFNPGIYLAAIPGIDRLDFRVEAPSTQPMGWDMGGQFNYFNNQYRAGNTTNGTLLGNAVGRDGRAVQAWTTYWFSARSKVEASYRQAKTSAQFLPGGATKNDATVKTTMPIAGPWRVDVALQYERYRAPLLGGARRNASGWLQVTWDGNLRLAAPKSRGTRK